MERRATMMCPLGSIICKLIYSIALMNYCARRWGDALDLIQDCMWVFILGFGLPIRDPRSSEGHNGICRVSTESHGFPSQQRANSHAMVSFNTTYCLFVPQLFDDDDAPRRHFPVGYIHAPNTWQLIQSPGEVLYHLGRQGRACVIIPTLINGA